MAITPKSLANLTPWPKGQSGNLNGRPRINREAEELLESVDEDTGLLRKAAILDKLYNMTVYRGDMRACRMLLDMAYGREALTVRHIVCKEEDSPDNNSGEANKVVALTPHPQETQSVDTPKEAFHETMQIGQNTPPGELSNNSDPTTVKQ